MTKHSNRNPYKQLYDQYSDASKEFADGMLDFLTRTNDTDAFNRLFEDVKSAAFIVREGRPLKLNDPNQAHQILLTRLDEMGLSHLHETEGLGGFSGLKLEEINTAGNSQREQILNVLGIMHEILKQSDDAKNFYFATHWERSAPTHNNSSFVVASTTYGDPLAQQAQTTENKQPTSPDITGTRAVDDRPR